ncbi:EpsG family protein [Acinetobacter seifertii]|nr:EpsG family protein [Acinetobacter seifertii]
MIIVFFIALIVSNRGAYVDNDYQTYKLMFDDYSNFKVEPVFKYFSNLLNFLHLDFTYLLFIFCFFLFY